MLYAVLSTDTQTLKYHLVTVKPSFSVKTIDCTLYATDRTHRMETGKVRYVKVLSHLQQMKE